MTARPDAMQDTNSEGSGRVGVSWNDDSLSFVISSPSLSEKLSSAGSPASASPAASAQLSLLLTPLPDAEPVPGGIGRTRPHAEETDPERSPRHAPSRHRSITGMRANIFPENKGGLPKVGHVSICYQQNIYVFGGVNGKGQYSNHVFCHEKRTLLWHEIRGVGVVPRGRCNHAAALVGSKMYIYGGHRQLEVLDDLYAYDLDTSRWEKIVCERSQSPGAVFLHSMVYVASSESLLVLGGFHQREQNSCLGHLFDIRNRVWTGVPPPSTVNPQHLQLVSAVYSASASAVVVLGLMDANVMEERTSTPRVDVFFPDTFLWRRIETITAPDSPLPFCMEDMWESFLHDLIPCGGGVYDPVQQSWLFPLAPKSVNANSASEVSRRNASPLTAAVPPLPVNRCGFFILDLSDMSWSLVSCRLPRKLLAELNVFNRAEREKMDRYAMRSASLAAATALLTNTTHRSSPPNMRSSGILSMPMDSPSVRTSGDGSKRQQGNPRHPTPGSSILSIPWGNSPAAHTGSVATSTDGKAAALLSASRYRHLFIVEDAPEFMRKYTLVAVRDEPGKTGKLRPMLYVVLHGGLVEPTDYAMLVFAPILGRAEPRRVSTLSARGISRYAQGYRVGEEDDFDDEFNDSSSYVSGGMVNKMMSPLNVGRERLSRTPKMDSNSGSRPRTGREGENNDSDDEDDDSGEDGYGTKRRSFLLPLLPSGRNGRNYHRFALQFTPSNSVQKESLLPYPNIPVAVLHSPEDMRKWSRHYYIDHRKWISEKLREAIAEDRKFCRMRRHAKAHQAAATNVSGTRRKNSAGDSVPNEADASDDSGSMTDSFYAADLVRGGQNRRLSLQATPAIQAYEEQLALESTSNVVPEVEPPKHRLRDFFEEHGLDAFDPEVITSALPRVPQALLSLGSHGKGVDGNGRNDKSKKTKEKGIGVKEGVAPPPKRSDPGNIRENSILSGACSTSAIPGDTALTIPGYERLHVKGRRDPSRDRFVGYTHHGASVRALPEVRQAPDNLVNVVAFVLLVRGIARSRAENDPLMVQRRNAQLRWRYLRAVVRTGEAAYRLYLDSQAESRMKGVTVSGTPGLLLAPELHFMGPLNAYKVPCKPVPYNLATAFSPSPASSSRFAQVTPSGMVVYHSLK